MFRQYSKEPAISEEITKAYHKNGKVYTVNKKYNLRNGGISEEHRIYRDNGKLLSLSQRMEDERDKYIRYTDWSDLGHRRLDFAARNNISLYFKYYPAYYKERSSAASIEK